MAPVTVTVKVPAVLTISAADVPTTVLPSDHEYVPPPLAVSVVLGVVQFNARPLLLLIDAVGTVLSNVVVALAVAVHPMAPVTVTVKVPAVLTVSAADVPTTVLPSDHEYVPPPLAVSVVFGVVQFNARPLLLLIDAVGTVLSNVVVALAVAVHPLAPVTITVKVPAVLTISAADVPTTVLPSDHEYDVPPLAVSVVLGVVQFNARPLLLLIDAVGTVLSNVVVALAVAVHPMAPVTVTVKVPAVLTVSAADAPTTVLPSDHEYVPPPLAVSVVLGVVQFNARPLLLLIATVGKVLSNVVVALAVAVHPMAPVTVTVKVPAVLTISAADVPTTVLPSDHEYDVPPLAVTLIDAVVQVRTVVPVLLVIPAVGLSLIHI